MNPEFYCEVCNINFSTISSLHNHLKSLKHKQNAGLSLEKNFYCEDCNKDFIADVYFRKHLGSLLHKKNAGISLEREFYCEVCDKYFNSDRDLQSHLGSLAHKKKSGQSLSKQFYCEACDQHLNTADSLRRHSGTLAHKKNAGIDIEKIFHCEPCNKYFNSKRTLQQHTKTLKHKQKQNKSRSRSPIVATGISTTHPMIEKAEYTRALLQDLFFHSDEKTDDDLRFIMDHANPMDILIVLNESLDFHYNDVTEDLFLAFYDYIIKSIMTNFNTDYDSAKQYIETVLADSHIFL